MIPKTHPAVHEVAASLSLRSQSLHSTVVVDSQYENVELQKLYEATLKAVMLEYVCEARFYKPLPQPITERTSSPAVRSGSEFRKSRLSRLEPDALLPSHLIHSLKLTLNKVAMAKNSIYNELTRRLLLRFYGELLDPSYIGEISRVNSVDILVMKFVSTANKEITKLGTIPAEEVSATVFSQAETFIEIIIKLVRKDRNSEALVAKLNEHRTSLSPQKNTNSLTSNSRASSRLIENSKLPTPSFTLLDIDQSHVELIKSLFDIDANQLQQDISRLKPIITQKALSKDLEQVLFYVGKDIGRCSPNNFASDHAYSSWKKRTTELCQSLSNKYSVPAPMKLLPAPQLPSGDEFYIIPVKSLATPFYVNLCRLCILDHRKVVGNSADSEINLILTNKSKDLLSLCSRLWQIDVPTRAVGFYSAAHLSGLLLDPIFSNGKKDLGPISLHTTMSVLQTCKRIVEDSGLDWELKDEWTFKDQDEWANNLSYTYSETFYSIKDCLGGVLSKTIKPKFGPYLTFLQHYVESDSLFYKVEAMSLPKKWEKRLTKTFLRTAESLYAGFLEKLPRDNTVNIAHVLEIADGLIDNVKLLQKRYKNPLLGFLDFARTYAALVMEMFASDAKSILNHIVAHINANGQFLNYGDALEAYKSLCEVRSIQQQTSPNLPFSFDLEQFFILISRIGW